MVDEFKTFEEYANTVKVAMENVIHDYNMNNNNEVQIIYATPPAAFAKFSQNTENGKKSGPLISFYLSNIELPEKEQIGGWKLLNVRKQYQMRAPVIAKLHYTVTINAIKESQADLLQTQILMAMPFNRPYATELNNQWVVMTATNPENLSSVDVGQDEDKSSKRQVQITIDRAYLEYPVHNFEHFIQKINSHIFSVDASKERI